jgi:DNA-binding transcriptional LysR family regulator
LLNQLSEEAPKIGVKLLHDSSRKITELIVSYQVDLAYVVNPPRHPDLVLKKIGDDRVTFWRAKGHAHPPKNLIADSSREQIEDLLGKTFHKYFRGWNVISSTNLELIRTLTSQGLGVGILPERVATAGDHDLTIYDSRLPSRPDEIFLAYRREVLSSRAGKELLRHASFQLPK